MPYLNNDNLDDPILNDGMTDFRGGMFSFANDENIPQNACRDMSNMVVLRTGEAQTRPGMVDTGDTSAIGEVSLLKYYDTPSLERVFAIVNNSPRAYDGSTWASLAGYTATSGSRPEAAQLIDTLYIVDGTQRMYSWDGSSFSQLTGGNNLVSGCSLIESHTNRLFASGRASARDTLYISDILTPTTFNTSIRIGGGEGDPIIAIKSWHNFYLLVFKENSIWAVNADPAESAANWTVELVARDIGCVARRSVCRVGNDMYFLSDNGVRSISSSIDETRFGVSLPVSEPITDRFRRINSSQISKSVAVYHNNQYILSVPLDSQSVPATTYAYTLIHKCWQGEWTGWSVGAYVVSRFSGVDRLLYGDTTDGQVFTYQDYQPEGNSIHQDDGVDYSSYLETRGFIFGDPFSFKSGYSCSVVMEQVDNSTRSVEITYEADDDTTSTEIFDSTYRGAGAVLPVNLPFTLVSPSRRTVHGDLMQAQSFFAISIRVAASSGKIRVGRVLATAFLETISTNGIT